MHITLNPAEVDNNEWSKFVFEHPNGTIFQSPEFFQIFKETRNYEPTVAFAIQNNKITGVLLGVIQKEKGGLIGRLSSRCVIWGGPIALHDDQHIVYPLLYAYNQRVKNKAVYTQIRNSHRVSKSEPFLKFSYKYDPHLNIHIDVDRSFDVLKEQFHKSRLRNYKKSLNKGCKVREIDYLSGIQLGYSLLVHTYRKNKLPLPDLSHFISLFNILSHQNKCWCLGAFKEDQMIGFRIALTYKNRVYDYFAGSATEFSNMYPNDVLIIEILKKSCMSQYTLFDFGGAGKPNVPYGVRDHKLKFGTNLVEFGRYEKLNHPALFKIVKLGFKLWQSLK